MVKETKYDHHPVRIEKGLFLGSEQLDLAGIYYTQHSAVLASVASSDDLKWALLDLAAVVTVPDNAVAAILDVAVNDEGSAGAAAYAYFSSNVGGQLDLDSRLTYVYCGNVNDRVGSKTIIATLTEDDKVAFCVVATGAVFDYKIKLIGYLIAGTRSSKVVLPSASLQAQFVVNQ